MSATRTVPESAFYGEFEYMPYERIQLIQLRKLQRLIRRAYDGNPFYRRRFDETGVRPEDIRTLDDYTRLVPLTRKEDIVADQRDSAWGSRLGVADPDVRQVTTTGGTSGKGREVHALSEKDVETTACAHACGGWAAGIRPGDRVLNTLPFGLSAAGQWVHRSLVLQGTLPLNVGVYDTDARLGELTRFRPRVVIATTSYLLALAKQALERGIDPAGQGVEILLTAGEPYTVETIEAIESAWGGARVFTWYGSTQRVFAASCERGAIAGGALGMLHVPMHLLHLEVVDPDSGVHVAPGEFGEVIHTFLPSEASPILRYAGGDRARYLRHDACPCGRTYDGVEGGTISRYDDMIKIRGVNVWPAAADEVVFADPRIVEYQALVILDENSREVVTVEFELADGVPPAERDALAGELAHRLHGSLGLRIETRLAERPLPRFTDTESKPRRWRDERLIRS